MKEYEIFSTTADVGIRVWGDDCTGLCRNAVRAFGELVFGKSLHAPAVTSSRPFRYRGDSCENILVNLLSEVLYLVYEKRLMAVDLRVRRAEVNFLDAEIVVGEWPKNPLLEVKSVTYHNLAVHVEKGRKRIDLLMDI